MITAQELRIGNIVFRKSDMFMSEVHSVWPSSVKLWCNPLALFKDYEIEPVEISEEILLKVGFVSGTDDGNHWWFTKDDITINYSSWTGKFEFEWQDIEIKHLHQLQNLYFALTGQELNTTGLI